MTDEPRQPEDGTPEPHGVVETIREEIEEAVEHVPEPVRWTVGKLVRLGALVLGGLLLLSLVSAVLFAMNRTELVAREIALLLNRTLRDHSDLVLDLRDIRGNPFTGFRAIEPRVRFTDGRLLVSAREMRVNYSAWSLVTGGDGSIDVVLDRPTVRLVDAKGQWQIPGWHSDPRKPSGSKSPRTLQVRLRINGAEVLTPEPYGDIKGMGLSLVANTGPSTRMRLDRMHWDQGPWGGQLERLTADVTADANGVRGRIESLRTSDLELRADGVALKGDPLVHAHVTIGRVRWAWLAKVFDNGAFDVPGEGACVVDVAGRKDWVGRFRATVNWDGLDAEGTGRAQWAGQELRVDSLVARSAAGDLKGALRWSRAGWEIAGDASGADPSNWQMLHLDGWPRGDMNGWFRYAVDTRIKEKPVAFLDARLKESEWQGWRADSARVRVDFPPVAADSFSVVGMRRGGRFTLRGHTSPDGWSGPYTIRELPLEEWPDGRATGLTGMLEEASGTVEARRGELFVTGDLAGRSTDWAAARFARWTLAGVKGRLLPTPDLTAQADAEDGFFTGVHIERAAAPIWLGDEVVRFTPLTAQAGDTTFAMTGQAAWDGRTWWMTLPSAEVASSQFHFRAEPPVRLSGDAEGTVFERVIADDRGAHLEVNGRWAAPGGPYDFTLTGRDVDVSRVGMPTELGLGGRADLQLRIQGRSGDPRWRFTAAVQQPMYGGHVGDSLAIELTGGAHKLELEDGMLRVGGGSVRGSAFVDRAPAAFPDSLSPTAVVRWLKDAGLWRGRATADAFPVGRLTGTMPGAEGWDGKLFGTLSLNGRPSAPVVDLQAQAERFGWRDIRTENVTLRAHYADGKADVQDLRARMLNVESTARLTLPLHLALGDRPRVGDSPIRGRVDIPSGDLQVLPLIVPQLQSAKGRFELAAEISGTAKAPRLEGRGRIRDGRVRPINRGEVVEGLNADLHFDQSRITLDTLTARQGRTGRIAGRGAVHLDGAALKNYRFDLAMRDFASSEEGLYAVLFDGDFVVSDGPRVAGERLPQVVGTARLKKGVIEFDFANQTEVQKRAATTQPLYWTYRIRAEAKNNLRWRTADADMEFDADLDLQQTPDSLLIYGEMHALRGQYWFLSNRFRVLNADLTFDNQQGVDPLLDIAAETRLPAAPGAPLETITAQLTGRSSKPVIALSSSANSDQRTILGALTVGSVTDERGTVSVQSPLDNYVTRQLNAQLSENLSAFFAGRISEWEVRRDRGGLFSGEGGIVVGVGSQVTDNLAFRYRQRLPGNERPVNTGRLDPTDLFDQNVEAEYRVNRFIFLTSGFSRRRGVPTSSAQTNTDYNVNLKARWEY